MRIALACPYALETPGGVQAHVTGLAGHLSRRGHAALVLAPDGGRRPVPEGVRVFGRAVRVATKGTEAFLAVSPLTLGTIRRALRGFRPDIVHVHDPYPPSTSLYAAIAAEAPLAATFHAYADRSRLMERWAFFLRPLARRIELGIAVSQAAAALVKRSFPLLPLEVVPNGVETRVFAEAEPDPLPPGRWIVWVSRLEPRKGFPVLLDAFVRLAGTDGRAALAVVGEGKDREAIDRLPRGVRGRVLHLGAVENGRVPRILAAADVFVSAALGRESFGVVLAEAMAAGAPVVATDIPGYREVVRSGVDGLLVPPNDPVALAEAMARVLSDPALASRLKAAGRARAKAFDWETVTDRMEELYAALLAAPSRPARAIR